MSREKRTSNSRVAEEALKRFVQAKKSGASKELLRKLAIEAIRPIARAPISCMIPHPELSPRRKP